MDLIEPKEVELEGITYRVGKFPAVTGREIITKYPISNLPKIGDYGVSQEIMLKLMAHVERVNPDGSAVRLSTEALVNNHVPSWEVLVKLEAAALEHNCSFFQNGKTSAFLEKLGVLAQRKATEILTGLLRTSSQAEKPHTGN